MFFNYGKRFFNSIKKQQRKQVIEMFQNFTFKELNKVPKMADVCIRYIIGINIAFSLIVY